MKSGPLFIVGFEGTSLSTETKNKLLELKPAGIILYDSNIESQDQVRSLIKNLKSLLGSDLIVTVDQEGGKVERLRKISTSLPSMQAIGRASATDLKYFAEILALEMLDLGFNLALAPCADLNTNSTNPIIGSRSLGSDSKQVAEQIKIITKAMSASGLRTCAKHFPGHGDTSVDSHLDLPIVDLTTTAYAEHLLPFKSAIDAGVDTMMISHVYYPQIDQEKIPATFSKKIIQGELRDKLNFKGLVISDELTMGAVAKYGSPGEVSKRVIEAGCDLLLWFTNLDQALEAANYLGKTLDTSSLTSFDRISEFKAGLQNRNAFLGQEDFAKHQKAMQRILDQLLAAEIEKALDCFLASRNDGHELCILVFDHPKLERELISSLSGLKTIAMKDFSAKQGRQKNLIILSFQTANYPEQALLINELKNNKDLNILHLSTDLLDEGADIHLLGANKVHLQSFLRLLAEKIT